MWKAKYVILIITFDMKYAWNETNKTDFKWEQNNNILRLGDKGKWRVDAWG